MKKRIALFAVSIAVFLYVTSLFGIDAVFSIIVRSNLSYVFMAVICQVVIFALYGLRFKVMSSKYKDMSFKDAFYITVVGNFVNLLSPVVRIGGQPLMIYLAKEKIGSAKSSAIVLTDTIADMLSSVLLVVLTAIIFYSIIPYQIMYPLVLFSVITIVLIFGFTKFFLSKGIIMRFVGWVKKKFKKRRSIFQADVFTNSFRHVLEDKKIMPAGMAISFVVKFFEMLRMWLVFLAIGIPLSGPMLLIVWSFMLVIVMIPWLPGHLGLFEFSASSAFILLGIVPQQAAGGVVLDRLISFWFVIVFSLIVIWASQHRLGELMSKSKRR
ncbi:flippase-like domain-containing protein [archaeon]|nr:flippase-like domain-containing protein [archaeon]